MRLTCLIVLLSISDGLVCLVLPRASYISTELALLSKAAGITLSKLPCWHTPSTCGLIKALYVGNTGAD